MATRKQISEVMRALAKRPRRMTDARRQALAKARAAKANTEKPVSLEVSTNVKG